SALEEANKELGKRVITKAGEVSRARGTDALRQVLQSADPLATRRQLHEDGSNTRDELLDVWHRNLTGQTIFEWKAAQTNTTPTNSAGFVEEPAAQVAAQVQAVKDGRKGAVVMGTEQAAQQNLAGLQQATVTDPR